MSTMPNKHYPGRRQETHTPATHVPSSDAHAGDVISYFPKAHTDRVLALLGGPEVFRIPCPNEMTVISMLRTGFPASAVDFLGTNIQASTAELAQMLGMSTRILARRRREGVLSSQESERLFRSARAIAQSEEAFGDLKNALDWLRTPLIVLGGATPISLLDTEIGGELVWRILINIVYGLSA